MPTRSSGLIDVTDVRFRSKYLRELFAEAIQEAADAAQENYLGVMSVADDAETRPRPERNFLGRRGRAKRIAEDRAYYRKLVRDARRRASQPPLAAGSLQMVGASARIYRGLPEWRGRRAATASFPMRYCGSKMVNMMVCEVRAYDPSGRQVHVATYPVHEVALIESACKSLSRWCRQRTSTGRA